MLHTHTPIRCDFSENNKAGQSSKKCFIFLQMMIIENEQDIPFRTCAHVYVLFIVDVAKRL